MLLTKPTLYAYSVARIRGLETTLLDASVFNRMAEAEDINEVFRIWGETIYSKWLADLKSPLEFEKAFNMELDYTYNELTKIVPNKKAIDIFRLPYDFHNIKVALKNKLLSNMGKDKNWDLLSKLGTIPLDTIIGMIELEEYSDFPYLLKEKLPEIVSNLERPNFLYLLESEIDHLMYATMLQVAFSSKESFLVDFVKVKIDLENLRTLLRLKRTDQEVSVCASRLLDGGHLLKDDLLDIYTESMDSWAKRLYHTKYYELLDAAVKFVMEKQDYALVEVKIDEFVLDFIHFSKYKAFGVEPVVAYLVYKETEIKNLRTIFVCKSNLIPPEEIRRRLRRVA